MTEAAAALGNSRDEHLFGPGPKRILALDGGGVRGVISLAYLEWLEAILRERYGPDLVLADYRHWAFSGASGAAADCDLSWPCRKRLSPHVAFCIPGAKIPGRPVAGA